MLAHGDMSGRQESECDGRTQFGQWSLTTQGGKSASSANVNFGYQLRARPPRNDWYPGDSWTFQQLFSWGALDPTDKPIRILAVFDDQTQNAIQGRPHYRKPADIRIDLTCTK